MRAVIAIDPFKGSLSSLEAGRAAAEGIVIVIVSLIFFKKKKWL